MADEFNSLQTQGTWHLVPPPSHRQIIGCKWVFRNKRHLDGSIARYKARFVAKGYHQKQGIDYTETFSPMVKQQTIRLVLSLAITNQWKIQQLDVSNAFLHGLIDEEIYMIQPQGFVDSSSPNVVCKFWKDLYGLKQAPRTWYSMLSSYLLSIGFISSKADTSLFTLHKGSSTVLILVYVDDILVTGNDPTLITSCIQSLKESFSMKDLGELSYFLGIEVSRTHNTMFLSQTKYATEILQKAVMLECKPISTPIPTKLSSQPNDDLPYTNPSLFHSLVGSLQYLTIIRPEIAFSVNYLCQKMHSPSNANFAALKRVIRYIKGTNSHGLLFRPSSLSLTAYSDFDWAGDSTYRRSTYGFCIFFCYNLISWTTKKQSTVARSSTESEYRALALVATEVIWLTMVLKDLGVDLPSSPLIWCDYISAISLAYNPVFHSRTKHTSIVILSVKELLQRSFCLSTCPLLISLQTFLLSLSLILVLVP